MVGKRPSIEIRLLDFTLTAVQQGGVPQGGVAGGTQVRFELLSEVENVFAQVNSVAAEFRGDLGEVCLDSPILGEDSFVDVYLRGPSPTILSTEPLARSSQEVFRGDGLQHFRITYRGAVGEVSWRWITPQGVIRITLECFPTKLDYRKDFTSIKEALEDLSPSLTASVSGAASGLFGGDRSGSQSSDGEWLENLRSGAAELQEAVNVLLPRLRSRVDTEIGYVTRDRVRRTKPVNRNSYWSKGPGQLVQVRKLTTSSNDSVNGYLKWEIIRLRDRVNQLSNTDWFKELDENITRPVKDVRSLVQEWLRALAHISPVEQLPNLHVRLRDPVYGRAFRSLHALRDALEPLDDFRPVGLKDLPTLYEYWVFLEVASILKEQYPRVLKGSSPLVQRAGPDLVLTQGRSSEITLSDDVGNVVRCQYNRRYVGLPTTNQRPDSVIEIARDGQVLIVDAKYRLGRDERYLRQFNTEGPLPEDINVVHRYRDAIVSSMPPHRRLSNAGIIAFPGSNENRYRAHHFYRSWLAVRIGGIPLLPGRTELMRESLAGFFSEALSKEVV